MLREKKSIIPYSEIDYEIRDIVRIMNSIDGIETVESCSGHDKGPCHIFFVADSIEDVTKFMYSHLYCNTAWRVSLVLTDTMIDTRTWDKPIFLLESTILDYSFNYMVIDNLLLSWRLLLDSKKVSDKE